MKAARAHQGGAGAANLVGTPHQAEELSLSTSIIPDLSGYEVWFLTGSQGLYGEDTLRQVADQSREIARVLGEASDIPVTLTWKPVLKDSASIRRAMLDANADDKVIGVVAWMHTFSPAKMWIAGLDALDKPLLHLHTQANVALPWSEIDMDFMNLNQAAHGDREFGYIQTRLGVARKTVVGHATDPRVTAAIGTWSRAAAGWRAAHELKLARFGDNMRYVAVTEGDKTEAELRLGVQVNTWGVNDLADAVQAASAADIDALISEYLDLYDVVPALRPGGDRHESLRYGAAIEVGLRSFLTGGDFSAFTTTFEDLGALRQLPGLAVQRLMADGYGFGAEGDWKTAVLVRIATVMGAGLPGGASLMEDYTYHMVPGEEKILGAHMLEVSPGLTTSRPSLEIHALGIGGREDPVRLVFNADSGPAVVVALSDMRDRFRLTANVVDVIQPDEALPKLPVARAVWKPEPDFHTSAAAWLTAGAAHHTVMTTAVGIEAFQDFADMAGIELLTIDATTDLRSFTREIRLNAAYYKLAQGL
jgi:L-arabinose isomerase